LAIIRDHGFVVVIGAVGVGFEDVEDAGGLFALKDLAAALVVDDGLRVDMLGRGDVEFAVEDGVAGGVFVDVGGAVADPLAGDENGQFDVEFDLAHLERGGVPVAHEVADQALVISDGFGAFAVGNAGGLADGGVVAHIVDDADKAVVEDFVRGVEVFFHAGGGGAQGLVGLGAGGRNFGLLFFGDGHGFLAPMAIHLPLYIDAGCIGTTI